MFEKYQVKITLTREMLGTNPCDPNVMDVHILDRQRKLILEKNGLNKQINKYLNQIEISKEKGEAEVNLVIDKLESLMGVTFTEEERGLAIKGELESLKQTFKELDIKGTTVFFWNKEQNMPCIGDHMIYGFLKASAEAIGRTLPKKNGTVLNSTSYTQSLINQHLRADDAFITFNKDIQRNDDGSPYFLQRSLRAMTAQGPRITLAKSEVVPAGASLEFNLKVMKNSPLTEDALNTLFIYGQMTGLGQWRNSGKGSFIHVLTKLP